MLLLVQPSAGLEICLSGPSDLAVWIPQIRKTQLPNQVSRLSLEGEHVRSHKEQLSLSPVAKVIWRAPLATLR